MFSTRGPATLLFILLIQSLDFSGLRCDSSRKYFIRYGGMNAPEGFGMGMDSICADRESRCPARSTCCSQRSRQGQMPQQLNLTSIISLNSLEQDPNINFSQPLSPTNGNVTVPALYNFGCCPFSRAVCCPDGKFCCPKGFSCNLASATCDQDPGYDRWNDWD